MMPESLPDLHLEEPLPAQEEIVQSVPFAHLPPLVNSNEETSPSEGHAPGFSIKFARRGDLPQTASTEEIINILEAKVVHPGEPAGLAPTKFSMRPHTTQPGGSERTTQSVREVSGHGVGAWRFAIQPSGYRWVGVDPFEVQRIEQPVRRISTTGNRTLEDGSFRESELRE